MRPNVFEYEKYLIPPDQWNACGAPQTVLDMIEEGRGCAPISLAKHPVYGWAIILASEQGPFIVWSEVHKDNCLCGTCQGAI